MLETFITHCPPFTFYQGRLYRIVETQQYAATTGLVDNLEEQALLEQLLDEAKPPYKIGTEQRHYLISTPFRYPPLKYGSRFGNRHMPSYFYGSEHLDTVLAECAFYRLKFMHDMTTPYDDAVNSEHMTFSVSIATQNLADLCQIDDEHIQQQLCHPTHYQFSQAVGRYLTEQLGAQGLRYYSARRATGINLAIAEPDVIKSAEPETCCNWMCQTTMHSVSFNFYKNQPVTFSIDAFLVDGQLPELA